MVNYAKPKEFPELWIFLIATPVAEAAVLSRNFIKLLLANGSITFFINGKPSFINGSRTMKPYFFTLSFFSNSF